METNLNSSPVFRAVTTTCNLLSSFFRNSAILALLSWSNLFTPPSEYMEYPVASHAGEIAHCLLWHLTNCAMSSVLWASKHILSMISPVMAVVLAPWAKAKETAKHKAKTIGITFFILFHLPFLRI